MIKGDFQKVVVFGESLIRWSTVVKRDLRTYPGVGGAPASCSTRDMIRDDANVPAGVEFSTQVSIGRKADRRCISFTLNHTVRGMG